MRLALRRDRSSMECGELAMTAREFRNRFVILTHRRLPCRAGYLPPRRLVLFASSLPPLKHETLTSRGSSSSVVTLRGFYNRCAIECIVASLARLRASINYFLFATRSLLLKSSHSRVVVESASLRQKIALIDDTQKARI
jgi:hypothetical protein